MNNNPLDNKSGRGFIVAMEGPDGVGKTTQIKLVELALTTLGISVISSREPGGTDLAEQLREILKSHPNLDPWSELFLIQAARISHYREKLEPALNMGSIVLIDRWIPSTLVYQGIGRSLGYESVMQAIALPAFIPAAELTLVFDAPQPLGDFQFSSNDNFEKQGIEHWEMIRNGFLQLSSIFNWHVIDATAKREEITSNVVSRVLEHRSNRVSGTL